MAAATKQRVVNKTERRLNRRNTCATVCISSFLPDNCEIDLWCDKVDLMDDVHKYQYLLKWKKWIVVQLSAIFYPLTATLHTASYILTDLSSILYHWFSVYNYCSKLYYSLSLFISGRKIWATRTQVMSYKVPERNCLSLIFHVNL